jgi:hypothetical protein
VGEVEETGGHSVDVQAEDASALRDWFSGEAGSVPKIMVYQTLVRVDEWLKGPGEPDVIAIVYVPRWHPRDSEPLPLFDVHDRGLLRLRKMAGHLPYASYVPAQRFQLCLGEKGMRKFLVTVYDDQGHAYTRDDTAAVSETIAALRWYLALPRDDADRRREDLFDALRGRNPQIVYHSIRELAETSAPYAAETFKKMLTAAAGRAHARTLDNRAARGVAANS